MADSSSRVSSEDIYRRVFQAASEGLLLLDRHRVITDVNPALLALTGLEAPDLIGRPEAALYTRQQVEFFSASRDHLSFETSLLARGGREVPVLVTRTHLRDESGTATGYMVFIVDLTELKSTQEELRRAEKRYHNMYRNAVQGMFQSRLSGELIRVNPAYARFLGYAATEEMLKLKAGAVDLYYDPAERGHILRLLKRKGVLANYEVKLRRKDGTPAWVLANYRLNRDDPGGEPIIEGIMVDNTRQKRLEEELRREHRKLQKLSLRDNLTGLYNTRFLYQALDKVITESCSSGQSFSLIFMDMDNFKRTVDTHGHLNGSLALREVARTIRSLIRAPGFGVAYGGDEFVLVLPGCDKARALSKAEAIRRKMQRTTYLPLCGGVALQASFGLATFPEDSQDRTGLLALADQAMFRVKQTQKGVVGVA